MVNSSLPNETWCISDNLIQVKAVKCGRREPKIKWLEVVEKDKRFDKQGHNLA